ncbi:mechanosensitive ion channel family protein [Amaricoccus macauensis]|uniref:mechanosensitive ion channel family protein n=1 Tax=Amaricoccus macauensis TaxID=57001 RepID=UPI003C7EAE91
MKLVAFARHLLTILFLVLACSWTIVPALAQEEDPASTEAPTDSGETTADSEPAPEEDGPSFDVRLTDPETDMEAFNLLLQPLTVDDLAALAGEWQGFARDQTETLVEAKVEAISSDQDANADELDALTETRGLIFAKYEAVLDQWEKKGGDPAEIETFRTYRRSILVEEQRTQDVETLARRALAWALDRDGGLHLVIQVGIILGALFVLALVAGTVRRIARRWIGQVPNLSKLLQAFIVTLIYWITMAIGLMVVLSSLGIDITPVFALIGGASFIIAFAMQDTLGNLAAGLMIMINRPFDEGDYVDIGGVGGTVKSVSIVSTTVTTPDNQVIVVPNSSVWGNVITNVTASPTRRVDLVFGIGYDDSIEDAQRVLEEVVQAHPMTLADPAPVIRVNELGASSVDFVCRPWVNSADYWTVYWDLTRQVKEAFDKNGISIPYPQTDMHVHMDNAAAPLPIAQAGSGTSGTGRPAGAPDYATGDDGYSSDDTETS